MTAYGQSWCSIVASLQILQIDYGNGKGYITYFHKNDFVPFGFICSWLIKLMILPFIRKGKIVDSLKTLVWILNERQILIWSNHVDCLEIWTTYMLIVLVLLIIWDYDSIFIKCQDLPKLCNIFWSYIVKDWVAKNQLLDSSLSKDLHLKIR